MEMMAMVVMMAIVMTSMMAMVVKMIRESKSERCWYDDGFSFILSPSCWGFVVVIVSCYYALSSRRRHRHVAVVVKGHYSFELPSWSWCTWNWCSSQSSEILISLSMCSYSSSPSCWGHGYRHCTMIWLIIVCLSIWCSHHFKRMCMLHNSDDVITLTSHCINSAKTLQTQRKHSAANSTAAQSISQFIFIHY